MYRTEGVLMTGICHTIEEEMNGEEGLCLK